MTAAPELDGIGRLVERVAGYYDVAPGVWWTIIGLAVLGIIGWTLRGVFGKRKE